MTPITSDKYGPLSVDEAALAEDAVTGEKLAPLTNRGLDQTNDLIGITNDTGALLHHYQRHHL